MSAEKVCRRYRVYFDATWPLADARPSAAMTEIIAGGGAIPMMLLARRRGGTRVSHDGAIAQSR